MSRLPDISQDDIKLCCMLVNRTLGNFQSEDAALAMSSMQNYFSTNGIKDVESIPTEEKLKIPLTDVDDFNRCIERLLPSRSKDIIPDKGRKYDIIALDTCSIEVFVGKLAFLSRIIKNTSIDFENLIVFVENREHLKESMSLTSLNAISKLFKDDLKITSSSIERAYRCAERFDTPRHRDGMTVAWMLVSEDVSMRNLFNKFIFYDGGDDSLKGVDELIDEYFAPNMPVPDRPVGFISDKSSTEKLTKRLKNILPLEGDSVDILVSGFEGDHFQRSSQCRAIENMLEFKSILEKSI